MTRCVCVLALVAACGGKAASTSTTSSTTTATAPAATSAETAPAPEAAAAPPPARRDTTACANRPDVFGPVELTAEQADVRYGERAKKITDAPSSKELAIEVCGIPASTRWMRTVTCANGEATKVMPRTGSVGPGGRCNSIIDLYEVVCPEQTYEVYVDIYMCGPGEQMR